MISIPPKYLVGIDRNSQRIRRLAAFMADKKAKGWSDKQLDSYYREFLRRIGGPIPKAGVVVKVELPGSK